MASAFQADYRGLKSRLVLHFNARVALWQNAILCGRTVVQEVKRTQDVMLVSGIAQWG